MNNAELILSISRCRSGDSGAFRSIVEGYEQLVFTLCSRLLGNEDEASDATQQTFIKVWLKIDQYNEQYKFSTWIYKIASNICYDYLRQRRKFVRVGVEQIDFQTDDCLDDHQLRELIVWLTQSLTPKQKLVFTLCDLQEIEVDQVVEITGLSPEKIKSNLYLARKQIKAKLTHYER